MKPRKKFKVPRPANNANVTPKWTVTVLISAFVISLAFSAVTTFAMADLNIIWAFLILFVIIGINVLFDIIGTSVLSAEEYNTSRAAGRERLLRHYRRYRRNNLRRSHDHHRGGAGVGFRDQSDFAEPAAHGSCRVADDRRQSRMQGRGDEQWQRHSIYNR